MMQKVKQMLLLAMLLNFDLKSPMSENYVIFTNRSFMNYNRFIELLKVYPV